jgi:hypothetical protein
MTVDMLHKVTLGDLARLHPLTKRELIAYLRNQIQIITGNSELIVDAWRNDEDGELAKQTARSARKFLGELEVLFAERAEATHKACVGCRVMLDGGSHRDDCNCGCHR